MKTPTTLISDIYRTLEKKDASPEAVDRAVEQFGEDCKEFMRDALQSPEQKNGLRLSNVGKNDRELWHILNGSHKESIKGPTYIKFLYGHLVEAMMLALVEASGHSVTDRQKKCDVAGVKGHMDGRIDGIVMDVKSCSSYGFKKFKEGTLPFDDPFGYVGQLKAYAHSEGERRFGWLAMDKQNGTLCWLEYDLDALKTEELKERLDYDIVERVEHVKKLEGGDLPPVCHELVADGKSGNLKLPTGCSYCPFKRECYPNLRTFLYGSGPRYLVNVENEPRVLELEEGF